MSSEIQNKRLTPLWPLVMVFFLLFLATSVLGVSLFRLTLNSIVCGDALTFPGTEACPRKNRAEP